MLKYTSPLSLNREKQSLVYSTGDVLIKYFLVFVSGTVASSQNFLASKMTVLCSDLGRELSSLSSTLIKVISVRLYLPIPFP